MPSAKKPKAVGKIKQICKVKDGIAVVAAYSSESYVDVTNGKFSAMSPRWQMSSLGSGKYRPVKLISVGLTNNPNIPESGRIIRANSERSVLKESVKLGEKASRRIEDFSGKIRDIFKTAKYAKEKIDSLKLSERLSQRNENKTSAEEQKIDIARIASVARERSIRLGEPYTKSFAAVKKQML